MVYFTLKLSEDYEYSYEITKISPNIQDFNLNKDNIFYFSEDVLEGGSIDFWKLSDFGVYSGNVYKIIDSDGDIATVIDYDDIYDINNYLYHYTGKTIIKIDNLTFVKGHLANVQDRTGEILCDICEVDIPKY